MAVRVVGLSWCCWEDIMFTRFWLLAFGFSLFSLPGRSQFVKLRAGRHEQSVGESPDEVSAASALGFDVPAFMKNSELLNLGCLMPTSVLRSSPRASVWQDESLLSST